MDVVMLSRLRRTRDKTTITWTVKMPIDEKSRLIVDAEVESLRRSVIPICGEDARRRPYLVGSAVVLVWRGRKVLVTAQHVLDDNLKVPLFFFGEDGCSRPFGGAFEVSETHDLAAKLLPSDEIAALSHVPFLREDVVERAAPVGERFYASVAGYPATAAKRKDRVTLDTPMEVYSNFATEEIGGHVSVIFNKKEGAASETGHGIARDPVGKSGGAIFGLRSVGPHIKPDQTARLVGVPTRWNRDEKAIRGPSAAILVRLLDNLVGMCAGRE
jgi:hypothetical protein